jgi:hypothetical protein
MANLLFCAGKDALSVHWAQVMCRAAGILNVANAARFNGWIRREHKNFTAT